MKRANKSLFFLKFPSLLADLILKCLFAYLFVCLGYVLSRCDSESDSEGWRHCRNIKGNILFTKKKYITTKNSNQP